MMQASVETESTLDQRFETHPLPSPRYLELERMPDKALERIFLRGVTPSWALLEGWVFRGTNTPAWTRLVGIKKFMKGFWRKGGEPCGYNIPVVQSGLTEPWEATPSNEAPKRFGFYAVEEVDPEARDNAYLHAMLLNYGHGGNFPLDPTGCLRDYLVQVDSSNPDLFLGKALLALGPLRVASNFFILERDRTGPHQVGD